MKSFTISLIFSALILSVFLTSCGDSDRQSSALDREILSESDISDDYSALADSDNIDDEIIKIKVAKEDRACEKNEDCGSITLKCPSEDKWKEQPINRENFQKYTVINNERCKDDKGEEVFADPPFTPVLSCIEKICMFTDFEKSAIFDMISCEKNDDCVLVSTDCDLCPDGLAGVNKSWEEGYNNYRQGICKEYKEYLSSFNEITCTTVEPFDTALCENNECKAAYKDE